MAPSGMTQGGARTRLSPADSRVLRSHVPRAQVRPLYWCCAEALNLAVSLPQLSNLPAPAELRQRVVTVLDNMVGRGRAAGISDADLAEARYALVAFIDEQVLKSNWPGRAEWMGQPLQLDLYREYTAGENFFNRMRNLLQQGGCTAALEVYYLCLVLGFRGAYGVSGDNRALASFRDAARQRVVEAWPAGTKLGPRAEPPDRLGKTRSSHAPLIAVVVGTVLVVLFVVIGLERLLKANIDESLDIMADKAVAPASASSGSASSLPMASARSLGSVRTATAPAAGAVIRASGPPSEVPAPGKSTRPPADVGPSSQRAALVGSAPPGSLKSYPQNVANRPVPRIGNEPWLISEPWRAQHERQLAAPNRSRAKLVFLGDSITAGWVSVSAYRDHFRKYSPLNLGIAGDHTQNLLWRIEQGTLDSLHPELVVILIGVNNLGGGFTPEQTAGGVGAVVRAVRKRLADTPVLLLAILPAGHSPTDRLRQKVVDTNRLIKSLAEPGRVTFADIGSVLLEPDRTITKATLRDYLHPTADGYERLSTALEPIVQRLMGGGAGSSAPAEPTVSPTR
ncbi:MAG: DotU/TssL family secretion system protein [Polyangiaceae bacterium]|nr:DotU/TssL family secretion system protein [Polyangiaceae bacterium]